MKTAVIYASRYGSTAEISEWIAQRFAAEGYSAEVINVSDANSAGEYDLVLLGSGIYSHGFLPELETFIEKNADELSKTATALFGVAMMTTPMMVRGKAMGGLLMLEKYAEKLGKSCISGGMLHGEMSFSKMTESDRKSLEKFYSMLSLSPAEIEERKKPRTLMEKKECWDFAEKLIRQMQKR